VCCRSYPCAVTCGGTRHRLDIGAPALVKRRGARDFFRGVPGAVGLIDDERLLAVGGVKPARTAVARRGTRYRVELSKAALVERSGAGDLLGSAPSAVSLVDDQRLLMVGAAHVEPARAAVARRGAGHRSDIGEPALVKLCGAGDLLGAAPSTARGDSTKTNDVPRTSYRGAGTSKHNRAEC
jgi:hypothetical protein